jgi:hypothetical protein
MQSREAWGYMWKLKRQSGKKAADIRVEETSLCVELRLKGFAKANALLEKRMLVKSAKL